MKQKKLTLDEAWDHCLRMWQWIAEQIENGSDVCVATLKHNWIDDHGMQDWDIFASCFFCQYDTENKGECQKCPAFMVDSEFDCMKGEYRYCGKPIAFYNKIVELNKKRLEAK